MLLWSCVVVVALLAVVVGGAASNNNYPSLRSGVSDMVMSPRDRAVEMVAQMSLSEKFAMMAGRPGVYVGNIVGNDRLGIPSLNMQDGPQVRS
jgi:hypothetical protein